MTSTRRRFLQAGVVCAGGMSVPAVHAARRPNLLFVITDQLAMDAISAHGCRFAHTPNIDRVASQGMSFRESYSTDPVCSPARSSLFTGRMPSETGVTTNGLPIRDGIPNLGEWLSGQGYQTAYCGKWHVPGSYPTTMPGFTVLPGGVGGQGNLGDAAVSRACQGYLQNRKKADPFLLVASFLQPHDICDWVSTHQDYAAWERLPKDVGTLPELPANFRFDAREPSAPGLKNVRRNWTEAHWRYYLWSYYRQVEMVDAEIGRVLDALEDSGEAENTVVVLTSDHGEGCAHHQMTLKNYLYDESAKVPLIVSWRGNSLAGKQDRGRLVSGVDLMSTFCDYAGVKPPANALGRSLRPLAEGRSVEWREFVAAEVQVKGRMVRTMDHKYIVYRGDPVEQFFDMKTDAGETANVAGEARCQAVLADHRKLLKDWESRLKPAPAKHKAR